MTDYRLTMAEGLYDALRSHLLQDDREEVALLFAHPAAQPDLFSLIVRRWEPVPSAMLLEQCEDRFSVNSDFIVSRVKQARARGESLLLAHSHAGDPRIPHFSPADDAGERNLYPLLQTRLPGQTHGAVVMSPGGGMARFCLPDGRWVEVDEIRIVGRRLQHLPASKPRTTEEPDEAHARQLLIWGSHGQGLLRHATVGVVGVGGTGSVVAQQLIHLGVGHLIVIDNQEVTESNLSRIVGAQREDIDRTPKVDVVARVAARLDPRVKVSPVFGSVTEPETLAMLKGVDLLFLCTDKTHHGRAVVNALAVQYLIPLIDLGFDINVDRDTLQLIYAVGEVRVVVPGGYCLSCAGVLNADIINTEKTSPEIRQAYPGYFQNLDVDDPSVITLNSTIASLAVTLGCDVLIPTMRSVGVRDSYLYNAVKGLVRHVPKEPHPDCGVCSAEGRAALADSLPLPR